MGFQGLGDTYGSEARVGPGYGTVALFFGPVALRALDYEDESGLGWDIHPKRACHSRTRRGCGSLPRAGPLLDISLDLGNFWCVQTVEYFVLNF